MIGVGVLGCAWILSTEDRIPAQSSVPDSHAAAPAAEQAAKVPKSQCLSCHGPFDKIIESTSDYTALSGEKISPHRYVPHDSKKEDDIPECTNCHAAHPLDPLPEPGTVDLKKVDVQWCYTACHHEKNFTPCAQCH